MAMHIHQLEQGSAEWLAYRKTKRPASYAAIVAGCSPFMSRNELLDAYATGLWPEPTEIQQEIFAEGHRVEALYRSRAEEFVGQALYPVVGDRVVNGVDLSASMDGFFEDETGNWECKQLNEEIRAALPNPGWGGIELNDARGLPLFYRMQMEQQCLVAGIDRVLFVGAEYDRDGNLVDERLCWYESDPDLAAEIVGNWKQFNADLVTHKPVPRVQKVVAEAVEQLPALTSSVEGKLVVRHNFKLYGEKLRAYIERLPKDPQVDQDFANLREAVKRLGAAEKALDAEEERALASLDPVNEMRTEKATLQNFARTHRLAFDKLVTNALTTRRQKIQQEHQAKFDAYVLEWNGKLGLPLLSTSTGTCPDAKIAEAMSGKKSVQGWIDGAAQAVADGKKEVDKVVEKIQTNQAAYAELVTEQHHKDLFRDLSGLLFKDPEAFRIIVGARISDFKAREEKRLEEERARIRQEEEQRAAEAQRQKNAMALQEIQGIQQQVAIATLGRAGVRKGGTIECIRDTLAETEAWVIDERFGALQGSAQAAKDKAVAEIRELLAEREERDRQAAAAPAPTPAPAAAGFDYRQAAAVLDPAPAPVTHARHGHSFPPEASWFERGAPVVADRPVRVEGLQERPLALTPETVPPAGTDEATVTITALNARLGFAVTSAFLEAQGIHPSADRNAKRYRESDVQRICIAIRNHLLGVMAQKNLADVSA